MNNMNELAYWMTLAHAAVKTSVKNDILIKCFNAQKSVIDFFSMNEQDWNAVFGLDIADIDALLRAKEMLPNNAFTTEDLLNQGYSLIPSTSPKFPELLKKNLRKAGCPVLLYAKGNVELLNQPSVAVVGARTAGEVSLDFTKKISAKLASGGKVIVSGFAKGVDREALDAAVAAGGSSIIVLPQGISTFSSGFKQYYRQIVEGKVLVVSVYAPKVPWSTRLAMDRNNLIYGMASEIYVAESNEGGGTWSGVVNGLRRGCKIYVRKPNDGEKNANQLLIEKGCSAIILNNENLIEYPAVAPQVLTASDSKASYNATKKDDLVLDLFENQIQGN